MNFKFIKGIRLLFILAIGLDVSAEATEVKPLTESIARQLIQQAVNKDHIAPGIVIGFVDEQRSWVEAYGNCRADDTRYGINNLDDTALPYLCEGPARPSDLNEKQK
jgi:hypothetical protein